MEIMHSIMEDARTVCPQCDKDSLTKMISAVGGIIVPGREANQFADIQSAKYWRDKNGVRHKVTASDGHSGAPTIKKQTATPREIHERKKKDRKADQNIRKDKQLQRAKDITKYYSERQ